MHLLLRAAAFLSAGALSIDAVERRPQLVKDINTAFSNFGFSNPWNGVPADFCDGGEVIYFTAADQRGRELWKSDGTPEGTVMVKDISAGSMHSNLSSLTRLGTLVIFKSRGSGGYWDLWRTDGTANGTFPLARNLTSPTGTYESFAVMDGCAYFAAGAPSPASGVELWRTDGTENGTVLFKDIEAGLGFGSFPSWFCVMDGTLYFRASPDSAGELWKSDGTSEGTVPVKSLAPDAGGPSRLFNWNHRLFFAADAGTTGAELWTSDGTGEGTVFLKDLRTGITDSSPRYFVGAGDVVFFIADDPAGIGLWRTDDTADGTFRLIDLSPFSGPPIYSYDVNWLTAAGGRVYFTADDGTHGEELWTSDGTVAGTRMVKDITAGSGSSSPVSLLFTRGALYFVAKGGFSAETAVWRSDGTADGTVEIKNFGFLFPGQGSEPGLLTASGGHFYLRAPDPLYGLELWISDGTIDGTIMLKDLSSGTASSDPAFLTPMGDKLFFSAYEATAGRELWTSDGTAVGTMIVRDIAPGSDSSSPEQLTVMGSRLYFTVQTGNAGRQLWTSDGTAQGTEVVKLISQVAGDPGVSSLTVIGNRLFFSAATGTAGRELWTSDGTSGGTLMVVDLQPAPSQSSGPHALTNVSGTLFFVASDGITSLWKSNGTAAGTVRLGSFGSRYDEPPFAFNGALYFWTRPDFDELALGRSDGTPVGTAIFKDFPLRSDFPTIPVVKDNAFYFALSSPGSQRFEFWKSDGTAEGTATVIPSEGMGTYFEVGEIGSAGGKLYLSAEAVVPNNPRHGSELWTSNGTAAGTVIVKELRPGSAGSDPRGFVHVGRAVYFTAWNSDNGEALWRTDDTADGTDMVADINTGSDIAGFSSLTPVGSKLFFADQTGEYGRELFVYDTAQYDDDGDTLPDNWEAANLGTLAFGPADDFDGDGHRNLSEWLAGTSPSRIEEYLRLDPAPGPPTRVRFELNSVLPDVVYWLQSSPTMAAGTWTTVTEMTYRTPGPGLITALPPGPFVRLFYRVLALPLP